MIQSPQQYGRSVRLYLLGTLVAIELLMSFSFLGYFHVEPLSVTIAYIPVLLAGALLGPADSTVLGTVFGLASMWKASAHYIMPFDQLFSPIMSGHPFRSILLSVGSRALFGLLVGLFYHAARKSRYPGPLVGVISFFGPSVHSSLVYSALWVFFPETGYTPIHTIQNLATLNGIVTALTTALIVLLIWRASYSRAWTQFLKRVETVQNFHFGERYHVLSLACIILLALLSSIAVAIYFVNRMDIVLDQQGTYLTDIEHSDLLHLQIQFLIGILSMMSLVIVFLIFNRRYTTYMDREAKIDALTGVLNRKTFFQSCGKALKDLGVRKDAFSYFIMIDMDYFKEVNDLYGHPEGDRVLKETALELETAFGQDGFIGRLGGDEFAVMVCTAFSRDELERTLQRFQERLHKIKWGDRQMSCSIGALPITAPRAADELYREADELLYRAKQLGRDQYVIGIPTEQTSPDNTSL